MLQVVVPAGEAIDERTSPPTFITSKECTLQLEHSLVSVSKWEARWKKPFLSKDKKTHEETIDYIRCMTLTQNVPNEVYILLPDSVVDKVITYIDDSMTATTFANEKGKINREITTAEIIYYWMIAFNIPVEFQKWHLNRLLTLIRVCSIKNQPPKKMSGKEALSRSAAINAARRKQINTNRL